MAMTFKTNLLPDANNTRELGSSTVRWKINGGGEQTQLLRGDGTWASLSDLGISSAMHFKGTTTTAMSDGLTTAAITIDGSSYTPSAGDVVLYGNNEFVWSGNAWLKLGDAGSFKTVQTAITDNAGSNDGTNTAIRFIYSFSQTANGVVSVKTRSITDASESASGIVNTSAQHFKGRKGFNYISLYAKNDSGNASAYSGDIFYYNGAGTQVAESWYSIGDATNITTGKFTWRQHSPNSTPDTSTSGYYETYQLPATKAGLSANKTYDILTCNGLNNVIPDSSDLNTYTYANNKLGVYNVPTSSNAATITNTPTTATGYTLFSFSGHYSARGHQVAWGASNTPWLRLESGTAGTWNDWQKLVSINATGSAVGSSSKPVYVTSAGLVTACDTSLTDYVKKSGDTMSGNLTVSKSASPEVIVKDTTNNNISASICIGSGHQNHGLYSYGYAPTASTYTTSGKWIIYRGSDGEAHSSLKIYGAVYNDYAEYREVKENNQPGRCVVETGNGDLILSTKRLQRGCEIISDTFGFAIGQSEKSNTPIATTGRVLAYLLEDKEYAKNYIGWPVCSGPNGTVSIMTEEEEEKYPSRIIGTISEIPDYEEWGSDNVKVDGRIWIRVR